MSKPSIYLDLERQEDWFKLEDAQSYLSGHADKCVIIDEIQGGFYESINDLRPDYNYVIIPRGERIQRSDGLVICPLATFLGQDLQTI